MHYKNERPAFEGDPVIGPTCNSNGKILAGVIYNLQSSGSDTCNCYVAIPQIGGVKQEYANIKDLMHAEDVWAIAFAQPENETIKSQTSS